VHDRRVEHPVDRVAHLSGLEVRVNRIEEPKIVEVRLLLREPEGNERADNDTQRRYEDGSKRDRVARLPPSAGAIAVRRPSVSDKAPKTSEARVHS
jgi:hypothetical protein